MTDWLSIETHGLPTPGRYEVKTSDNETKIDQLMRWKKGSKWLSEIMIPGKNKITHYRNIQ